MPNKKNFEKYFSTAIAKLAKIPKAHPRSVAGQPFDDYLLTRSPLYRKSRALYLANGGIFEPALCSSARSLSSAILLENRIEYTPHEKEMIFAAKNPEALLQLRTQSVCLFHEQNHRILWKLLPKCGSSGAALRRYLNFVESLVIALDVALGDEMGPGQSRFFYGLGLTYDPGSEIGREIRGKRGYRNYLQAILYSTYLVLEQFKPDQVRLLTRHLFPNLGKHAWLAANRSLRLDQGFITRTNLHWQKLNRAAIRRSRVSVGALELGPDPKDNRLQYLIGEKVFEALGL